MTYYICHGAGAVHYIEIGDSSTFVTGQPTVEEFTDEAAAKHAPSSLAMFLMRKRSNG